MSLPVGLTVVYCQLTCITGSIISDMKMQEQKMKVHISIRLEFLTHKYSLSGKNRSI